MFQVIDNWEHLQPIQKQEFTLAYLNANGGALEPETREKFIQQMIKESDFLNRASTITTRSDKYNLDSMRFGSRALHTASPGAALPQAKRTVPDLDRVQLSVNLFKAETEVEKEVFEDNIEQQALYNTILTKFSERAKEDVVEIVLNSNTALAGTDDDLAVFDGFYTAVTSHTVAAVGKPSLSKGLLESLIKTLPTEYRKKNELTVITGTNPVSDYIYSLGDRQTNYGDSVFKTGFSAVTPTGIQVVGDPEIREDLGVATDESLAVIANMKNFFVGFHPKIQIATDDDIRAGTIVAVIRVRFDAKWAWEDATAKLTGISGT